MTEFFNRIKQQFNRLRLIVCFVLGVVFGFTLAKTIEKKSYINNYSTIEEKMDTEVVQKSESYVDVQEKLSTEDQNKTSKTKRDLFHAVFDKKQTLSKQERDALDAFVYGVDVCKKKSMFSKEDKINVIDIKKIVYSHVKGKRVNLNYKQVLTPQQMKTLLKIRKCHKESFKNMTKQNYRYLNAAVKKMDIKTIINLYEGVR